MPVEPVVSVVPESPPVAPPVVHYSQPVQPVYPLTLHCDLCGVSANREDQLETHKRGARHLRMLKLNGLPVPESGKNQFFIFFLLLKNHNSFKFVSGN